MDHRHLELSPPAPWPVTQNRLIKLAPIRHILRASRRPANESPTKTDDPIKYVLAAIERIKVSQEGVQISAILAAQKNNQLGGWRYKPDSTDSDVGIATWQIPPDPPRESRMNQIFLVIDPANIDSAAHLTHIADGILDNLHAAHRVDPNKPVRYPGEETLRLREENLRLGIPVDPELWEKLRTQTI